MLHVVLHSTGEWARDLKDLVRHVWAKRDQAAVHKSLDLEMVSELPDLKEPVAVVWELIVPLPNRRHRQDQEVVSVVQVNAVQIKGAQAKGVQVKIVDHALTLAAHLLPTDLQ